MHPGEPQKAADAFYLDGFAPAKNPDLWSPFVFRGLARRMGYTEPHLFETDEQMVKGLLDSRHPYLGGVTYEQLRERGVILGAKPAA